MKTTKSKTQQTVEIPMLDFIAANPDMTAAEIASALNRRMPSVSGQIRQLRGGCPHHPRRSPRWRDCVAH